MAERGVRSDGIAVAAPSLDDDLCLAQAVKDFAVEQLVARPTVETIDERILCRLCALESYSGSDAGASLM